MLNFDKMGGLVPAIVQDADTGEVLMLGYMNKEALEATQKTKKVTFWSRSRNRLWTKGETSGNFLDVREIFFDCDDDALLIRAKPEGPTCHTGNKSCFFRRME
jgi:phosphoribosyl-ATP pyrophosphohydrolase/phosphoribosyl-AMP cyclohydrolase